MEIRRPNRFLIVLVAILMFGIALIIEPTTHLLAGILHVIGDTWNSIDTWGVDGWLTLAGLVVIAFALFLSWHNRASLFRGGEE